ncbi:Ig-like domain-containing protein [Vibrio cholerae]
MGIHALLSLTNLAANQLLVIDKNGNIAIINAGEAVPEGAIILDPNSNNLMPEQEPLPVAQLVDAEGNAQPITDDIEQILAALEEGADPTALDDLAPAAGGLQGSSITGSASIERDGAETIASTQFDTSGFEAIGLSRTQSLSLLNLLQAPTAPITPIPPVDPEEPVSPIVISSITGDNVAEGSNNTFSVSLSGTTTAETTIVLTLAGDTAAKGVDFNGTSVIVVINGVSQTVPVNQDGTFQVTVPTNTNSFSVQVSTIDDNIYEGNEIFTLSGAGTNSTVTGNATITDDGSNGGTDDRPVVSGISSPTVSEGDSATFDVSLSNASTTATTVTLTLAGGSATAGTDFTSTEVTITYQDGSTQTVTVNDDGSFSVDVPANTTTFSVSVQTTDDNVYEGGESFTLSGKTATQGTAITTTGTIVDNDEVPTIESIGTGDVTATEGDALIFTVKLSNVSSTSTSFDFLLQDGTATSDDYGAASFSNGVTYDASTGKITVPTGVTSFTVNVPTTNDSIEEADETVKLTIGGKEAIGTIVDNDNAPVIDDATVNNLSESIANGTEVYDVQEARTGNDTDLDGEALQYTFVHSNNTRSTTSEDGAFSIDPGTGKITVLDTTKLDYESATSIVLKVETTDGVNKDTADITLNLTNVNDSDTVFTQERETFEYAEGTKAGVTLGKVTATDADGENISYSIAKEHNVYAADDVNKARPFYQVDASGNVSLTEAGAAAFTNDYETVANQHTITVTATGTDGSGADTTDTIEVTLKETNVNDSDTVFTQERETFEYAEGTKAGVTLGKVTATDADGENISYSIAKEHNVYAADDVNKARPFYQVDASGNVSLTEAGAAAFTNDYETVANQHTITVTATGTDGSGADTTDTIEVTLKETNVNDSDTVFTQERETFEYAEGTKAGVTLGKVTATDADGENISYSIAKEHNVYAADDVNKARPFYQVDASGNVSLTEAGAAAFTNDYETVANQHTITVTATGTDGSGADTTDTIEVTLKETNVNDSDTVFTQERETFEYAEGTKAGVTLGKVTATDADGENISYSIAKEHNVYAADDVNKARPFYQVDASGNVSLTEAGAAAFTNDYETVANQHTITVTATGTDGSGADTTDTIEVTLKETNVNDSDTVFTQERETFEYAEGTKAGVTLGKVTATDADGENISYSIAKEHNVYAADDVNKARPFYQVDASGNVSLTEAGAAAFTNDYETVANQHTITVTATGTDGSGADTTDTIEVTLKETNVNDSDTVFTQERETFEYAEGTKAGVTLGKVTATDADGENISYSIAKEHNVYAADDVNKARPFYQVDASGNVSLTEAGAAAFTNDYETVANQHTITVTATGTDGSGADTTDTIEVTLKETNVNDSDTVFTQERETFEYAEGTKAGVTLGKVTATDADGENISYSIAKEHNVYAADDVNKARPFYQVDASGNVSLTEAGAAAFTNDYETVANQHTITVTATGTDGSGADTTDTIEVTLKETNVNDSDTVFTQERETFEYAEGTKAGVTLGKVTATDADGENISYSIAKEHNVYAADDVNKARPFYQVDASGNVSLTEAGAAAFTNDYETVANQHTITVTATGTDGSGADTTDTIEVTLKETNVNDSDTVFTQERETFEYAEGTKAGVTLGKVTATDADGENISYSIAKEHNVYAADDVNKARPFYQVDASGNVSLTEAGAAAFTNDYETVANQHTITVTATGTDGSGADTTDTIEVTLKETNVNDSDTVFTQERETFEYAEGTKAGVTLGKVTATDADGENISYSIAKEHNVYAADDVNKARPFYQVDASGNVSLTEAGAAAFTNDYETVANQHTITVTATGTDGSGADTTDTIEVTLKETNVNDSDTVFTQERETFEYAEGTKAGVTLGKVTATDADGENISYSIAKEHNVYAADDVNKARPFYQVDASGNVSLTEAGAAAFTNDYETVANQHTITVTATGTDGSGADTTDTIEVTLKETNVDEALNISGLNGANAELTIHESNLSGGSSPDHSALSKVGSFSFTSIDGLASLVIAGHSFSVAELLALNSSEATILTPYGELTLTGFSGDLTGGTVQYEYTLNENVDNDSATNANDTDYTDHISVTVIDVDGSQATDSLDIKIVDDVSTALDDRGEVDIVVDSFTVSGVVANWTSWSNGTNVTTFDGTNAPNGGGLDNDSGKDQIRWGQPASSYSSGYGFIDNDSALNGEFALNQDIILGTFTHYNYPVYSGGAITSASMDVAFSVTDAHGVLTPVTLKLNFDHNETPNTNDPEASKDIIKVGNTNVTFENAGALYTLQVIGFRIPGTNQIVTEIRTGENATNSYELVVRVGPGEGYELPSTSGNVLANDVSGADVDMTVVGAASGNHVSSGVSGSVGSMIAGLYGNLILLADGSYTYQVTANASSIPNDAIEIFTYTMKDGDGDTSTALLSINVNRVTMEDFNANQDHKVGLEDTVVAGNVLDNDGSKNTSVDHFTVGNDATSHAEGSPVSLEQGELTLNSDGSYTFKPADNWNGEVPVITYTTNTGKTSTLAITITPVDDATVTKPDHKSIAEDTIATGNVLANDSDIDSALSVTSFHVEGVNGVYTAGNTMYQLAEGALVLKENGDYTFDPKDNWSGSLPQITYTTNTGATGTLNIHVEAVADAPNLTINGYTSVAAINFEDARLNGSWDGVVANQIKGLNTIGTWHTSNNSGKVEIGYENIYVSGGSSTNKVMEIEFNNGDKTLYTDIHAQAGRFYELDFDIAARAGSVNSSGLTIKLVPLNAYGVPILAEAITLYDFNPTNANWLRDQKVTLPIDQTGEYRLLFESDDANSYGAILDNLAFKVVDNMGYRGDFIKLSEISTSLNDTDTSETLSLKLKGMPEGSILKDDKGHEVTVGSNGEVDITGWDYSSLQIKTPNHGNFNITVEATATESSNQDSATTSATIPVTVLHPNEYLGRGGVDSFLLTKSNGDNANLNIALNAYYEGTTAVAPVTQQVAVTIDTDLVIHSGNSNDYIDLGISRADNTVYTGSSIPNFNNSTPSQSTLADSAFMKNDVITDHDGVLLQSVQSQIQPITDTVNLGSGNDTVYGGGGNLAAYGGAGNDTLIGGDGNDALRGGADNDYLSGGRGNDVLRGDSGNDVLIGGLGSDILTGGSGDDLFKWVDGDLDNSKDRITDFTIGQDKIDLSDLFPDETRTLDQLLNSHVIEISGQGQNSEIVINKGSTEHVTIQLDGVAAIDLLSNLENIIHLKD